RSARAGGRRHLPRQPPPARLQRGARPRRGPSALTVVWRAEITDDRIVSERYLTEGEVKRVLDRAAEIEQREAASASAQRGLSVSDLERIAIEAGMSPANVRTALAEL